MGKITIRQPQVIRARHRTHVCYLGAFESAESKKEIRVTECAVREKLGPIWSMKATQSDGARLGLGGRRRDLNAKVLCFVAAGERLNPV